MQTVQRFNVGDDVYAAPWRQRGVVTAIGSTIVSRDGLQERTYAVTLDAAVVGFSDHELAPAPPCVRCEGGDECSYHQP